MDLKEIDIFTRDWFDSTQGRSLESPCDCGIEPPGSISHGVNLLDIMYSITAL